MTVPGRRDTVADQMGHDLVTIEIEVNPFIRTATLRTAEYFAVKRAGGVQIVNGESKVKRGNGAGG
jgi:hypothetical protein